MKELKRLGGELPYLATHQLSLFLSTDTAVIFLFFSFLLGREWLSCSVCLVVNMQMILEKMISFSCVWLSFEKCFKKYFIMLCLAQLKIKKKKSKTKLILKFQF